MDPSSERSLQILLDRGIDINKVCSEYIMLCFTAVYSIDSNDNICYNLLKILVRHVILMKSQTSYHVSDIIWYHIKSTRKLADFMVKCKREIERLKAEQFYDSSITCYDILTTKDLDILAALASNENIVKTLKSKGFKLNFPIYRGLIVHNLNVGIARKHHFEFVKRFFNYLSSRKIDAIFPNYLSLALKRCLHI